MVDEDSLAVEIIAKAMNGSRNFLAQPHSIKYLRSGEIGLADLSVRDSFVEWDRSGRLGLAENAQAEAERILTEHQVPLLEAAQEVELDLIMQTANQELVTG